MNKHPYNFLTVIIMPTDYCNMNCVYCFNQRRTFEKKKVMSYKVLENIFSSTIPFYDEVKFIWHGGEATSMGIQFFKDAFQLQKKYIKGNTKIYNSVQSNLTLLNEEFAEFFLENDVKIGGSFDGTRNELTRHYSERILNGREMIIKKGGRVGFICVVQSKNINSLIEDYEWFKDKKINYTINQYMPCNSNKNDELWVPQDVFVSRICELYDYWSSDAKCNISITYFEDFVKYILFGEKHLCSYNSCLGKHIGIQYDGKIFACNRDFPEELSFGNVQDYDDIRACFTSNGFDLLAQKATLRRKHCIENCSLYHFCEGGCNSVSQMNGDISSPNTYVCECIKGIYFHIESKLDELLNNYNQIDKLEINPYLRNMMTKKCMEKD